jgi:hypothetical protein
MESSGLVLLPTRKQGLADEFAPKARREAGRTSPRLTLPGAAIGSFAGLSPLTPRIQQVLMRFRSNSYRSQAPG